MRAWLHTRKGKIVGVEVGGDDTWMRVLLTEDAWADARRRRTLAGTVCTYHRRLMVETVRINLAAASPESGEVDRG